MLPILTLLASLAGFDPDAEANAPLQYNRDVRPILSENCFSCHGPDANQRKARLRLDMRENVLGRKVLVPGKPGESLLIERITSVEPDEVMPPPGSHRSLTPRQIETVRRWIAEGAPYQTHWAFMPPHRSTVPQVRIAGVAVSNPIDAFVFDRLSREGLRPSPEATKETLIRRVTLALTGLPPTLRDVEAFLGDDSREAYEKVVDRLLASPHFGERMAVDWLDAARFADSNGYQVDRDRELWPWRDWVIAAFNANMPFDQFTIEQIAGDLLPDATLAQRIATGFHRNHMLNEEGGIIAEEFLAEYTADRVETTAAVWLGQTFNCTRCHDHKFDPFTQRDFYAMKAFFHNVPERGVGLYSNPIRRNAPPFVKLPAPAIESRIAALTARRTAAKAQRVALVKRSKASLDQWVRRLDEEAVVWTPLERLEPREDDPPTDRDHGRAALAVESRKGIIRFRAKVSLGRITALRFECSARESEARLEWNELKVSRSKPLALKALRAGDSLSAEDSVKLIDRNEETRTSLRIDSGKVVQTVFELETAIEGATATATEFEFEVVLNEAQGQSFWRVYATGTDASLLVPTDVQTIARKPPGERTPSETRRLLDQLLARQPEYQRLGPEIEALERKLTTAEDQIPTTLVMEEMRDPRPTFVLVRGAYDKPGAAVNAGTPGVLPPLEDRAPRNRLGLANWLVSSRNPLTPRVTVNRFWQQCFGTGLVRTSEDFGSQGEPPSHPELLDWLAVTFRESGWDMKRLIRLIVTSATYRQQSHLTPVLRERDPSNRLLARGPRHRLMAEFIRDQALAASGLLVERLGGPSVKPYHPAGLYEQVTAGKGNNVYVPGKGDDLYRRSVYTYWKRSVPHPAMLLFDAPFRETCTLRRPRSNTPLQALNLMNDPTYVEAARFLAMRMIRDGGSTPESRLTFGFRRVLSRQPRADELTVLRDACVRCRTDFQEDPEAARALLSVGDAGGFDPALDPVELAAFAMIAGTMLNLDETVNPE